MLEPSEKTGDVSPASRRYVTFVPLVALLLFLGALFWAKSQDPFSRRWFTLKTEDHTSFNCVAVLPKPLRRYPVILYAHGSSDSLMTDGDALRQMAELGLATVSLDYDQTNPAAFDAQWTALLQHLSRQTWADTNAIAWVGSSLGANLISNYAQNHPSAPPQLLVLISAQGLPQTPDPRCPVLLIHGDQDEIFPVADTQRLAAALQSNNVPVTLKILPGLSHSLEPEGGVIFRCVGESCLTHLSGPNPWPQYHSLAQWQAGAPPLWPFLLPAGIDIAWRFWVRQKPGARPPAAPSKSEILLRCLAVVLALWAGTETALHLATPHFAVSPATLKLARRILVHPKERSAFEYLAAPPVWAGVKLQTLLDHAELAGYNRQLVNWQLDDPLFRDSVLSPVITPHPGERLDWRRPLWEEFYPRIRHETALADAVRIIVRHLRERVTVVSLPNLPHEVPDIWRRQITDPRGFAIIYVAALRSAGVPARLAAPGQTEYWSGEKWQSAPLPVMLEW